MNPELKKKLEYVAELKKKKELERQENLKKSAAIFKKTPGKILNVLAILGLLYTVIHSIDMFIPAKFQSYKIEDAIEERYDVISQDGWHVPATYYHVYLNKEKSFEVFMYKGEYFKIQKEGELELRRTQILGIITGFKAGSTIKPVYTSFFFIYMLPVLLFLFCALWLILKPEKNEQVVAFGYILMFALPILIITQSIFVIGQHTDNTKHDMDVRSLVLPPSETEI